MAPLLALLPLAPARTPRRINTEQSTHASLITSAIPFRHAGPRGKGLPPTATNLLDAWVPTTLEVVSQKQDRPRVCSNGLVTQTQVYTLDGTMSQDKGADRSPYFATSDAAVEILMLGESLWKNAPGHSRSSNFYDNTRWLITTSVNWWLFQTIPLPSRFIRAPGHFYSVHHNNV